VINCLRSCQCVLGQRTGPSSRGPARPRMISEISCLSCNGLQGLRLPTVLCCVLCLSFIGGFDSHTLPPFIDQWRPTPWKRARKTTTKAPMPSAASGLNSSGIFARSVGILAPQFSAVSHGSTSIGVRQSCCSPQLSLLTGAALSSSQDDGYARPRIYKRE